MKKFADMIMMILHSKLVFDQFGNAGCCPQLRPIPIRHGSFSQEPDKALFLTRCKLWRSARHWLGFQRVVAALFERIAPSENTARMTTNAPRNFMKRQLLLKKCNYTLSAFFKQLRRAMWSWHRDTPFKISLFYCITYADVNNKYTA
jgi:hypothetical protein